MPRFIVTHSKIQYSRIVVIAENRTEAIKISNWVDVDDSYQFETDFDVEDIQELGEEETFHESYPIICSKDTTYEVI